MKEFLSHAAPVLRLVLLCRIRYRDKGSGWSRSTYRCKGRSSGEPPKHLCCVAGMEVLNRAIESIMTSTDHDDWEPAVIHVTDSVLSLWRRGEVGPCSAWSSTLFKTGQSLNPPFGPDRTSLSGSVRCGSSPFLAWVMTATPSQ